LFIHPYTLSILFGLFGTLSLASNSGGEYDCTRPLITSVRYPDGEECLYTPLTHLDSRDMAHSATFAPVRMEGRALEFTPALLCSLFYSEIFLDNTVVHTNAYAKRRLPPEK